MIWVGRLTPIAINRLPFVLRLSKDLFDISLDKGKDMANSQIAFLARDQVPDRQRLQEAVKQLRFKLTIDEAYVPFECSGYLPCTLDGEDAGCDIRFGDATACAADAAYVQAQRDGRDTAMLFRWSGDPPQS